LVLKRREGELLSRTKKNGCRILKWTLEMPTVDIGEGPWVL